MSTSYLLDAGVRSGLHSTDFSQKKYKMCVSPIKIKNKKVHFKNGVDAPFLLVPCGRCLECSRKRINEFVLRSYYHYLSYAENGGCCLFVTLTYNNSSLPHIDIFGSSYPAFDYLDIKKFLKKLRRSNSVNLSGISYLICSELGKLHGRPHYHALIFVPAGISVEFMKLHIAKCWNHGFISFSFHGAVLNSIRGLIYTTKYISKDLSFYDRSEQLKAILNNSEKRKFYYRWLPRTYCSKHFGDSLTKRLSILSELELFDVLKNGINLSNEDNTFNFPIPPYVRDKFLYYSEFDSNNHVIRRISDLGYRYKSHIFDCMFDDTKKLLNNAVADVHQLGTVSERETLDLLLSQLPPDSLNLRLPLFKLVYHFKSVASVVDVPRETQIFDYQFAKSYFLDSIQFDIDYWNTSFFDLDTPSFDVLPEFQPYSDFLNFLDSVHNKFRKKKHLFIKKLDDNQTYIRNLRNNVNI